MPLDTYTPTDELEAVNAILAASNEAPILSLPSARPDVALAQAALASALREALSSRWRFNSDINYRLAGTPISGAFAYPVPDGLLAFTVTPTEAQRGLDIVARPSRTYKPSGNSVRILANRIGGVDTLTQSELFINPVWSVPFSMLPESARRFIVRSAVRRRIQQNGFSKEAVDSAAADEQAAQAQLVAEEGPISPVALSDGWASETDALNAILATAGQRTVSDVLEAEGPQLNALNSLRQAVIDVCAVGWRFNTEVAYGIEPENAVYSWNDIDGTVTPVLIYRAPDALLTATPSATLDQTGSKSVDPIARTAERYRDTNGLAPRVFYDRTNHRDGFPADERSVLWVDVTWRKAFAEMPEEARRYATIMAGRRVCATLGNTPRWTSEDESAAHRALQRAEGKRDVRNIFRENSGMRAIKGRTPRPMPGFLSY